jgi:DNA-binding transcriptional LysR family regulator
LYESRYIQQVNDRAERENVGLPSLASLDLNLFRVFSEVFQAQNLTHAAARLHLTQPAVSNALARLRAVLSDPLFVRDGRRMAPTPLARRLAPQVTLALSALESALRDDRPGFLPEQSSRSFTIGMRESPELLVVPRLGKFLAQHAPRISISSVRFERRQLPRLLRAAALDLAVDVRLPVPEDIQVETLFRDRLQLAVRRRHPLLSRLHEPSTWLSLRHVVVSARPRGPLLEDAVLGQLGISRSVAVRCQHYHAACQLVADTDLALLLPERYGEQFRKSLSLQLFPVPVPLPELEIALYWLSGAERDLGLRWLLENILSARDTDMKSNR